MPVTAFDTPAGPVACTGITPDLMGYLRAQTPAWPETDASDVIGKVDVVPDDGGWRFHSSRYEAPDFRFEDGLGAGNGLIGCKVNSQHPLIDYTCALKGNPASLGLADVVESFRIVLLIDGMGWGSQRQQHLLP